VLLRTYCGTHWELEKPFREFDGNPWEFNNKKQATKQKSLGLQPKRRKLGPPYCVFEP
jgi:hypothetical protein